MPTMRGPPYNDPKIRPCQKKSLNLINLEFASLGLAYLVKYLSSILADRFGVFWSFCPSSVSPYLVLG
jgi:hypothetical protein